MKRWDLVRREVARTLFNQCLETRWFDHARATGHHVLAVVDVQLTHRLGVRAAIQHVADAVYERADAWDVRNAATLLALAPGAVPASWFRRASDREAQAYLAFVRGEADMEQRAAALRVATFREVGGVPVDLRALRPLVAEIEDTPAGHWMIGPGDG